MLAPVEDPLAEERRRGVERFRHQVDHPLGSGFYGVAALAGAPPQARDRALLAGGLIDASMLVAPRAASAPRSAPWAKGRLAPFNWQQPAIGLRELNADGQAMGMKAWLERSMLGKGKRVNPRLTPPGWQGNGIVHNEARGHLLARSLGGPGGLEKRNFVTLTQNGANTPQMSGFEREVANRVRSGELVEYSVTPFYDGPGRAPSSVLMTAHGSRRAPSGRLVLNPTGRRK